MKATEAVREIIYPITQTAVLLALLTFFLLGEFAAYGGLLGLVLAFMILPAVLRYLMMILEARLKDGHPEPPDVDMFLWIGNGWSLFSAVWFAVLIYSTYLLGSLFGAAAMLAVDSLIFVFLPASLAVLATTRSPIQSLNPRIVATLIRRAGAAYWITVFFAILASVLVWWLSALPLAEWLQELIAFYLLFAFYALVGGVFRPLQLHEEVDIHESTEPGAEEIGAALSVERTSVLNHAYGFISRGNRAGGLQHIASWLGKDPEPHTAWAWFFEQMLLWEVPEPALVFAQQYLGRLLQSEERVTAVKVMLRCRMINEAFKPLEQDTALALEAAKRCDNAELAVFLERL